MSVFIYIFPCMVGSGVATGDASELKTTVRIPSHTNKALLSTTQFNQWYWKGQK